MKRAARFFFVTAVVIAPTGLRAAPAARVMEALGRGVVAILQDDGKVFVSWRVLATDPEDVAFNLYRTASDGRPARLNAKPLTGPTHFVDSSADPASANAYFVRPVGKGGEQAASAAFTVAANAPARPYLSIPLKTPAGYHPNDASVGDLDGDGEYEIVLHQAGRGRDNSQAGLTDPPILQAYKQDGTLLWTISLGKNIREGAHYTQFMVYDLDGDGRAEVACKTAAGTVDGAGKAIGDKEADWRNPEGTFITLRRPDGTERRQDVSGFVLRGPEYLTIFDGLTGAALATTDYVPPRHPKTHSPTPEQLQEIWGDGYGNRVDRFLAAVAYLDGARPSLVMSRGYYTRAVLAAWNWRGGKLSRVWTFDSDDGTPANRAYRGQGNHNLSVADVDGDGRGFGDAGANFRDARTGRELWKKPSLRAATSGGDAGEGPGRANAVNIDPRHRGSECWVAGAGMRGLWSAKGEKISESQPRACNFAVWWDGDLQRELLDRNVISKWNWEKETLEPLSTAEGCSASNGTKATPALSADILGDWREEVLWRCSDDQELRIYVTTLPTRHRIHTLLHDPQYRLAVAWQNVAYNQPPHPSFYLGDEAPLPPRPKIAVPARRRR